MKNSLFPILVLTLALGCSEIAQQESEKMSEEKEQSIVDEKTGIEERLDKYVTVKLTTDIGKLSDNQKKLIPHLIEAAKEMDKVFWKEAYGDKTSFLEGISDDKVRQFAEINYGPWDRLAGNEPFVDGVEEKPLGANYYPKDMTKEEFEAANLADKASLYTLLRRDEEGSLMTVPYYSAFQQETKKASDLLLQAVEYADNEALKNYLRLRAEALLNDDYKASDLAWMDMQDNQIDVIIGPIETYEDQLFGYKAAHEAYVLVKDMDWSKRLSKYATMLPELQENLPVDEKYKAEKPGTDSQLAAFDVVYYAGDCNSGSKTIAVNLPNDEEIQLQKGTRRSQLKNAMKAKFDKILIPIVKS